MSTHLVDMTALCAQHCGGCADNLSLAPDCACCGAPSKWHTLAVAAPGAEDHSVAWCSRCLRTLLQIRVDTEPLTFLGRQPSVDEMLALSGKPRSPALLDVVPSRSASTPLKRPAAPRRPHTVAEIVQAALFA